jgi:drug/metabolite transporter (DMT)-like permease
MIGDEGLASPAAAAKTPSIPQDGALNRPSLARGRLLIVLAAVLWSLSGLFTRVLNHHTPLRLGPEPVDGLTIAFYRVLFAGLVLLPAVRPRDVSFRPAMPAMVVCFAGLNLSFVLAMAGGKSSNAILLQYSAPLWLYLVGVWGLGEAASLRGWLTLLLGLAGVGVIIAGGWQGGDLPVTGLGLASGVFYAGVLLFLRALRDASPGWLTVMNHLGAAAAVAPLLLFRETGWPSLTGPQLGVLALFGAVQMGTPYLLMARGLRAVSAQEAGVITLLEPLLNPLWAYLAAPERERPTASTLLGGAFILGALAWRYWPTKRR